MIGNLLLLVKLGRLISVFGILVFSGGCRGDDSSTAYSYDPSLIIPTPSMERTSIENSTNVHDICIYTQWSPWSGECPPPNSCGGGIEIRSREPAGRIDQCTDIMEEKECENDCIHVRATVGLLVTEMIDNSVDIKDEHSLSIVPSDVKYTYGSLYGCSAGCHDIQGLDKDHDIVCLTCTNEKSCDQAGQLHMNMVGRLDIIRNRRLFAYAVKVDGKNCSCSFIPEFPLIAGLCSSPSYYLNLSVV